MLELKNKTNEEQTILVEIDRETVEYPNSVFETFEEKDLPFKVDKCANTANAEKRFDCFFIENPATKSLDKSIFVKLAPGHTSQVLFVLRAPHAVTKANLLVKALVHHVTDNSASTVVEKRIDESNRIFKTEKDLQRTKAVVLCGKLQNPTVICQKAIWNPQLKSSTIPLVARFGESVQKFKLQFKLVDEAMDSDFEFIFIKSVKPANAPPTSLEHLQFSVFECMTFFCLPAVLKVSPKQPATLTVQLNLNLEKLARLPAHLLTMTLTKLLVARVKGTNLIQSFYVTINLVEIPEELLEKRDL